MISDSTLCQSLVRKRRLPKTVHSPCGPIIAISKTVSVVGESVAALPVVVTTQVVLHLVRMGQVGETVHVHDRATVGGIVVYVSAENCVASQNGCVHTGRHV